MILCLIIILQNIYIFTYNYTLKIISKIQSNVKYFLMIIIKTESYSSKSYSSQIV